MVCEKAAEDAFAQLAQARRRAATSSWGAFALSPTSIIRRKEDLHPIKLVPQVEHATGKTYEGNGADATANAWVGSEEVARRVCNSMVSSHAG